MKIVVYVEGPSDRTALTALLRSLIDEAQGKGIGITFHPQHGKSALLDDVPRKAADHLHQNPTDWVIALPDLYPMSTYANTRNAHTSFADLDRLLRQRFKARAAKLALPDEACLRFRVHCLKHDLEALLLAAPDQLRERLRTTDALAGAWRRPVEDQNDNRPPKRVIEELFNKYRKKPGYQDTVDAPWILARATLSAVEEGCAQRFAPFVEDLRAAVAES